MSARGTAMWRKTVWGSACDTSVLRETSWMIGMPRITAHRSAVGAFRALGRILRAYRYAVRAHATGCYNCRPITGGTSPSAHAYGIALDVNWDTNPYRRDTLVSDMPMDMIIAIQNLRTDSGAVAFRWGGDWDGRPDTSEGNYDAMHFEIIATPEELDSGFTIPDFDPANIFDWPLLLVGEKGAAIARLQGMLNAAKSVVAVDGKFGTKTEAAVQAYQAIRGLPTDGVVGLGTWTALFSGQRSMVPGGTMPHKGQAILY